VSQNGVTRRIFGPRRDKVTGDWRILHNEELHILYSSSHTMRVIKSRRRGKYGRQERCIQGLVGKSEERKPFGTHRCSDNDKIVLLEIG